MLILNIPFRLFYFLHKICKYGLSKRSFVHECFLKFPPHEKQMKTLESRGHFLEGNQSLRNNSRFLFIIIIRCYFSNYRYIHIPYSINTYIMLASRRVIYEKPPSPKVIKFPLTPPPPL